VISAWWDVQLLPGSNSNISNWRRKALPLDLQA
jgi:hypothetical protein